MHVLHMSESVFVLKYSIARNMMSAAWVGSTGLEELIENTSHHNASPPTDGQSMVVDVLESLQP